VAVATSDPFADQRGLAKAGGGGEKSQFAVKPRVQPLDQARTRDQLGPDGRNVQFRLQERILLHGRPSCCMMTAPGCKYIMPQMDCQRECASA